MNIKKVEIFTTIIPTEYTCTASCSSSSSSSSCGTGSSCGCSGDGGGISFNEIQDRFANKYAEVASVKVYDINENNFEQIIPKLNQVFVEAGTKLIVNKDNAEFILSKVIPVIAVDGKLISVRNYPNEGQLLQAIISGDTIPMKPSCY